MNDLILTVDTGGSKTELTLFDAAGNELGCQKCSGLGTAHTALSPVDALGESVLPLLGDRAPSCVGCVVINVGGSNTAQLERAFASLFPHARVSAYRESSGIIMSALCDAEQADALLMAGTGSIALSKGPRGSMITDGWCPNVSDLGSGYWIGLEAIRRSVLSLENGQPLSPLAKEVTGFEHPFGAFESTGQQMELRDRVRARFMPLERARVAALTRLAAECAAAGDEMALEIFREAGCHLAKTLIRGLDTVGAPPDAKILVSGGLSNCFSLWQASFEKTLKSARPHHSYRLIEATLTRGALYFALHHMKRSN